MTSIRREFRWLYSVTISPYTAAHAFVCAGDQARGGGLGVKVEEEACGRNQGRSNEFEVEYDGLLRRKCGVGGGGSAST